MKTRKEIGIRIRQVRLKLKLSQQGFAKQIGVSNTAVSSYEIGDAFPSIPCLIKIVVLGNTTADWLLFGERMKREDLIQDESQLLLAFRDADQKDKEAILKMAGNAALVAKLSLRKEG